MYTHANIIKSSLKGNSCISTSELDSSRKFSSSIAEASSSSRRSRSVSLVLDASWTPKWHVFDSWESNWNHRPTRAATPATVKLFLEGGISRKVAHFTPTSSGNRSPELNQTRREPATVQVRTPLRLLWASRLFGCSGQQLTRLSLWSKRYLHSWPAESFERYL